MIINTKQDNGRLVFVLEGRLDTTTASQLEEVLLPAFGETKEVELDFTKLDYVSSAGLRILLMGHQEAASKGGTLTLRGISDGIRDLLAMTGFTDVFTIV